jgi:hypothetical protein
VAQAAYDAQWGGVRPAPASPERRFEGGCGGRAVARASGVAGGLTGGGEGVYCKEAGRKCVNTPGPGASSPRFVQSAGLSPRWNG